LEHPKRLVKDAEEWVHISAAITYIFAGSVSERLHHNWVLKNTTKKMDIITKTLNEVMNAKRAGKSYCVVKPVSGLLIKVLDLMKEEGYIDYKIEKKGKFLYANIEIKKLNEGRSIRPRFHFQRKELERFLRRYLPSRNLGIVIVSTDSGILTHREAIEKGVRGVLLAYCY